LHQSIVHTAKALGAHKISIHEYPVGILPDRLETFIRDIIPKGFSFEFRLSFVRELRFTNARRSPLPDVKTDAQRLAVAHSGEP